MVVSVPTETVEDISGDRTYPIESLPENSRVVLDRRYLAKDADGNVIESPREMAWRVANNLAQAEHSYGASQSEKRAVAQEFFELIANLDFMPNSPTLMNAGRDLQQLSACFVLPIPDSIEGIFDSVKWTAMIHKSGGGTGFSFSRLRPKNDMVKSTSGVASGPVSFMKIFNAATEEVKQGGTRRGANMGILRVDHPDILDFINCKTDMVSITNFNISVAVTSEFIDAVRNDREFDIHTPTTGAAVGRLKAREVFNTIVNNAWKNGDPGLVFIDRMNETRSNPVPKRGPIEATNPCGEQPLYPFDSCNLGSINLANFVVGDYGEKRVDYERLREIAARCVHFLDNVVDMNNYPIPQITEVSKAVRRIGLGVMGFADMLIELRVGYNTAEAVTLAENVMRTIQQSADDASEQLAEQRGAFPDWEDSIYGPNPEINVSEPVRRLRNSTRTTIAPTGTISIIAGCSGGCEPLFSLAFTRQHYLDKDDPLKVTQLTETNQRFELVAREEGFYSQEFMDKLAEGGTIQGREDVPEWVQRTFVTSHDISPADHIKIQAAFQRYTDNGVSKTINFRNDATPADVEEAYMLAYDQGCNGITIYRDGSRELQVLTHTKKEEPAIALPEPDEPRPNRRRLPNERHSITHKFQVDDQEGYLHVGLYDDGTPGEIFITIAKQGTTVSGLMDAIATLTSVALQYGVPLDSLVQKLQGTRFDPAGFTQNPNIPVATSITDYIFRYLGFKFLGHAPAGGANGKPTAPIGVKTGMTCPECGTQIYFSEGCLTCIACGYSKCG